MRKQRRTPSEAVPADRAGLLPDVDTFYTDLHAPAGELPIAGGDASFDDADHDHAAATAHVGAEESCP